MNNSNFRDLEVWQRARVLAREVYRVSRAFPRDEIFGLTQQMRRAAISVLSNIAEGQGRWTRRDAKNFMVMTRGSVTELEAQLVIAADLEYLAVNVAEQLIGTAIEVNRMLNGLIRHYGKAE